MVNLFALGLVLCSLVSGGFFSPPQSKTTSEEEKKSENYVFKEPGRVTIIEFEREAVPNADQSRPSSEPSLLEDKLDATKNKLKQASSVDPDSHTNYNPKELICDAYGKCKHKLAGVFGKAKESASEKADAMEKGKRSLSEKTNQLEQGGESVFGVVKDGVYHKLHGIGEMAVEGLGKTEDGLYRTGEKTMEGLGNAKDSLCGTGEMAVEKTKEGLGKAKDTLYGTGEKTMEGLGKAKDTLYGTGEMAVENTKEGLGKAKEVVPEKMQETKEKAIEAGKSGLFSSIFHRGTSALHTMGKHSKQLVHPTIRVAHLLATSTAYGMMIWVTFVSSHVLAGALPRHQFGMVQSKVYPAYFRALVGSIGCALGTHALRNPYLGLTSFQAYNMLAALGLVLLNMLWLEPNATKVMFEKMRLEKEEGRTGEEEEKLVGPGHASPTTTEPGHVTSSAVEEREEVRYRLEELDKKLKNLNVISSWLNVLTLVSLTWQLVYLGKAMAVV